MQLDLLALLEPTPQEILPDVLALGELPGPANRERTVAAWRAAHQPYIVPSRHQHPWWLWELHIIAPGARWTPDEHDQWRSENPGIHIPTVLSVDRRNAHDEEPTGSDEEHIWYRAACLGCDLEGTPFTDDNQAIEQAHDHTHPWWRDLPIVNRPKSDGTASQQRRCRERVAAIYEQARPGCTADPYPPIRTWRDEGMTRHHSGNPLGGYDLGVLR
jgi:hypothetical protein